MSLIIFLVFASGLFAQNRPSSCADCPTWNVPQQPFNIYGNTYYVGTHGLASILITSSTGHILIDGALPESVPQIVANIRSLGFRVEDIKLILNSRALRSRRWHCGAAEAERRSCCSEPVDRTGHEEGDCAAR